MKNDRSIGKAFRAAFPYTIPVMTGYLFLGLAYGVLMGVNGFSFVYPMCTAIFVFGGSLEYLIITLLLSTFAPLQALLVALMIQARHLFYGIAMLDRYKGTGLKKLYLIFALSDETFAVNSSAEIPDDVDKGDFYFCVSLMDQLYWVTGTTLGGLLGAVLPFHTEGLDFVMTAMFAVIFLDRWLKDKHHSPALIGIFSSILCLKIFGSESFLIPTMLCILCLLTLMRGRIEKENAE